MEPEFWKESNFEDHEVAQLVAYGKTKNQKQVYTLHGENSETKKLLNHYEDTFDENELYTMGGKTVIIDGPMERSYCLEGLNQNIIVFKEKIKHVMIRHCDDTRVYLNGGSIAGVDVLYGSNVSLRTPKHNYTNVEQSSDVQLSGTVDCDSLIHITQSLDVFINRKNLMINPFSSAKPLKMTYKDNTEHERLDIGELSVSPVAESCDERWKTKLMLMGQDISNGDDS